MRKRGFKKVVALLLMTTLIGAALSGCKGKDEKTSAGGKKTEITMMTFDYEGSPLSGEYASQVIEKMEDYTNTKVKFDWIPSDSYEEKWVKWMVLL